MIFINREKELELLQSEYYRDTSSFVVIYGRRRTHSFSQIERKERRAWHTLTIFSKRICEFAQTNTIGKVELIVTYLSPFLPINSYKRCNLHFGKRNVFSRGVPSKEL